jgi:hypothetical protein
MEGIVLNVQSILLFIWLGKVGKLWPFCALPTHLQFVPIHPPNSLFLAYIFGLITQF